MEVNKRISTMDALLFVMNLEVMLLQLRILEGSVQRCNEEWVPRSKIQKEQREKLFRDRQIVRDVFRRTLVEVAEDGESLILQRAIDVLTQTLTSVVTLSSSYAQLKLSLRAISADLVTKRHQWATEFRNCGQNVACLRDKIKDYTLNTNTQLSYAEKWLCARAESMELRYQFEAAVAAAPTTSQDQNRIHSELMRSYDLQIKEREESLENWKLRYEKDIANITNRLSEQCEKLRVAAARRTELQELYNLHRGEMRAWLTFKRERAARRAREERLRIAATRIQAWWRGVMVRRGLGTFRYLRNAKKAPTKTKKK